jgi:hypothetical protein
MGAVAPPNSGPRKAQQNQCWSRRLQTSPSFFRDLSPPFRLGWRWSAGIPFDHLVPIKSEQPNGSIKFAHFGRSKVQFPRVARRISTSILLATVLLAGAITPSGVCALMCERHFRLGSQHHCGQPPDAMPGMTHHHAITTHADTEIVTPVLMSQSCLSNCDKAERLNLFRRVVPQVTIVQTGVVVSHTTVKFIAPDPATAWTSDSGPPLPTPSLASFSILRI